MDPFRIKFGAKISKPYETNIGGVMPFLTNRYLWVGKIEKQCFLALRNH